MCAKSKGQFKEGNIKEIDYQTFKTGVPQMALETHSIVKRIFHSINTRGNGMVDWNEFVQGLGTMKAKNVEDKINLFFKMIDEDGNGKLSWDEVYDLCYSALEKYTPNLAEDEFMKSLVDYFCKFIFESVKRDASDEIPMEEIKEVISNNEAGADLLAMFCGVDS